MIGVPVGEALAAGFGVVDADSIDVLPDDDAPAVEIDRRRGRQLVRDLPDHLAGVRVVDRYVAVVPAVYPGDGKAVAVDRDIIGRVAEARFCPGGCTVPTPCIAL